MICTAIKGIVSSHFSYHSDTNTFVAEASDCNGFDLFQQIFDTCDQGFAMVSTKTGEGCTFVLSEVKRDMDGDVQYWEFVPLRKEELSTPRMRAIKVLVYND